jgi:hypothetical protein
MNYQLIEKCRSFLTNISGSFKLYCHYTDIEIIDEMKKLYPLTYAILKEKYNKEECQI